MNRPIAKAVDHGRYRQLARMMEKGQQRRRIVWMALMNRRQRLACIREARRQGHPWPEDHQHPVVLEAADWRRLADYGYWLERNRLPVQGSLFEEAAA